MGQRAVNIRQRSFCVVNVQHVKLPPEQKCRVVDEIVPTDESDFGVTYLGRAGFTPELTYRLDHMGRPQHVSMRKIPPMGIYG